MMRNVQHVNPALERPRLLRRDDIDGKFTQQGFSPARRVFICLSIHVVVCQVLFTYLTYDTFRNLRQWAEVLCSFERSQTRNSAGIEVRRRWQMG
jgi:hypothetical protein